MADGASPRQAVMPMIRAALRVAEGEIPNIAALKQRIIAAEQMIDKWRDAQPEVSLDTLNLRITPWIPPARLSTYSKTCSAEFAAAGCCMPSTRSIAMKQVISTMRMQRTGRSTAPHRSSRKSGEKRPTSASACCSATPHRRPLDPRPRPHHALRLLPRVQLHQRRGVEGDEVLLVLPHRGQWYSLLRNTLRYGHAARPCLRAAAMRTTRSAWWRAALRVWSPMGLVP